MGTTRADVVAMIRMHLAGEFNIRPSSITEGTDIRGEIPVESVDIHTLAQAIQDRFGVNMSSFRTDKTATVGDVVDIVMQLLDQRSW